MMKGFWILLKKFFDENVEIVNNIEDEDNFKILILKILFNYYII